MAYGHRALIQTQRIPLLKLVAHTNHDVSITCSGIVVKKGMHAEMSIQLYCNDCKETISSAMSAIQLSPGALVSNTYPVMHNVVNSKGLCLLATRKPGDDTVYADQAIIIMQNMQIRMITKEQFKKYFLIKGIHPAFIDYQYHQDYIHSDIKSGLFDFLK